MQKFSKAKNVFSSTVTASSKVKDSSITTSRFFSELTIQQIEKNNALAKLCPKTCISTFPVY